MMMSPPTGGSLCSIAYLIVLHGDDFIQQPTVLLASPPTHIIATEEEKLWLVPFLILSELQEEDGIIDQVEDEDYVDRIGELGLWLFVIMEIVNVLSSKPWLLIEVRQEIE